MKYILILLCLVTLSCSQSKDIVLNGKLTTIEPYGVWDEDEVRNDSIRYEVSTDDVLVSIIFCETVFVPIWLIGFRVHQPVDVKAQFKEINK